MLAQCCEVTPEYIIRSHVMGDKLTESPVKVHCQIWYLKRYGIGSHEVTNSETILAGLVNALLELHHLL